MVLSSRHGLDREADKVIYWDWKMAAGKPKRPDVMKTAQTWVFKTLNEPPQAAKR